MIAFNIGLPKRIVVLYTLIHNFRFLHHYGKYYIETSLLHMFGIFCLYSHGCFLSSDIPDYHIVNSRLSKYFEMEWFLLCRMHMRFVCSTLFFSVCDRDWIRWEHLDTGVHACLHSVYTVLFSPIITLFMLFSALKISSSCPSTHLKQISFKTLFFVAFSEYYSQNLFFELLQHL